MAASPSHKLNSLFSRFACRAGYMTSRPTAFAMACAVIVLWLVTGPLFAWGTTWQLLINTGTTIVTFLMVFLIQNSQNRETVAQAQKAWWRDVTVLWESTALKLMGGEAKPLVEPVARETPDGQEPDA